MKKYDPVKFSALTIGDYFSDTEKNKYRKIPSLELRFPGIPITILNAFHIQVNAHVSIDEEQIVTFIKHQTWLDHENPGFPNTPVELSELEHQLDLLEKYLQVTEEFLFSEINSNSQLLKEFPQDLDIPGEIQDFKEFVNIFQNSFFIGLYSFLETNLYKQCHSRVNAIMTIDSFRDTKGKNFYDKIEKVRKYLEAIGTTFPFHNDLCWREIRSYQRIRNCLTHNNGIIPCGPKYQNVRQYINAKHNLSCTNMFGQDYIILSNNFCFEALEIVGQLLKSMLFHNQADDIV